MPKIVSQKKYSRFDSIQCCENKRLHQFGYYKRSSDSQKVARYRCNSCGKTMSNASVDPAKWQKKRHLNHTCMMLLASCVSMRRISALLHINPKTVARKLEYLGKLLGNDQKKMDISDVSDVQFDELQTIEHTKCKPLAVAMAVSKKDRRILGFRVSKMPATGHLAAISRKKYGFRRDDRQKGLSDLFAELTNKSLQPNSISSDECSFYHKLVNQYFPAIRYLQFKGEKSAVIGQGELKKTVRDPLFMINHTFAMLRANINRLVRKTWCTTKKITRLVDHLTIYMHVHNQFIINKA